MKKIIIVLTALLFSISAFAEEMHKPYILGAKSKLPKNEVIGNLKTSLQNNNLEIVGEYIPAKDESRYVIVVTSEELKSAITEIGGLAGFAAAIRIGITDKDDFCEISYVNPTYLGLAYYREGYDQIADNISKINEDLQNSMQVFEEDVMQEFGSEKGLDANKLKKYKYMLGMPKFDDVVELAEFASYEKAVETIEGNLAKNDYSQKVYRIDFPEKKLTLFGIALTGEKGEEKFLPIIDIGETKHTAFLPYEILVMDKEVVMLHGRYRIALSFPDLTMGTFMKIMSTPGDIENAMKELTK